MSQVDTSADRWWEDPAHEAFVAEVTRRPAPASGAPFRLVECWRSHREWTNAWHGSGWLLR